MAKGIIQPTAFYDGDYGLPTSQFYYLGNGDVCLARSPIFGHRPQAFSTSTDREAIKNLRITRQGAKAIAPVIGRQSLQGFFIGVCWSGATIASFLGYAAERNIAPKDEQDQFGKGSVKGLAAPEAPIMLRTGSLSPAYPRHPGSGTTAILLGALIALKYPGPRLMLDAPSIFWSVLFRCMWEIWCYCLKPASFLYCQNINVPHLSDPIYPIFYLMASILDKITQLSFDAGWFGICNRPAFCTISPTSPIIGFILGAMLEDNFARSMKLHDGVGFI